jgi:hypothetical protein
MTTKFTPKPETLPPIGGLMTELTLNTDVVENILKEFIDNPPIPELANLILAEPDDD